METKKCPECGSDNRGDAKFCDSCGHKFAEQKDTVKTDEVSKKSEEIITEEQQASSEGAITDAVIETTNDSEPVENEGLITEGAAIVGESLAEDKTVQQTGDATSEDNVIVQETDSIKESQSENPKKKIPIIPIIIGAAVVVIAVVVAIIFLTRPKFVEIKASYSGATEEGIILDSSNDGFSVTGKTDKGEEKALKGWTINEPQTLQRDLDSYVTITYKALSCNVKVTCSTSAITDLELTYNGNTAAGTVLDKNNSGIQVSIVHKNGKKDKMTDWEIKKPETLKADESASVEITCEGITKKLVVECSTLTLEGISATYNGNTEAGTKIKTGNKDIVVTASYKNNKTKEVTDWTAEEITLVAGETSILNIHYEDQTYDLEIACSTLSKQQYEEQCSAYTYDEVARYPELYQDKPAKFTGKILQIVEGDLTSVLRLGIKQTAWGYNSDEVIYVSYFAFMSENVPRLLEGDIVTVYGPMDGLYTYKSTMGLSITIPSMYGKYIEYN